MQHLVLFISLVMSGYSVSAEPNPYILLKPKACALNNQDICSVDVLIEYFAPIAACLHINNESIDCTDAMQKSEYTYSYLGSETLVVALVDGQKNTIVEVELPVLQLAHYRRRQRNPWSLF